MPDRALLEAAARTFQSRSSLLDRLSHEHRRLVNASILDRDPPTYRGIYEAHRLRDHGVSYTAFFNYARRFRLQGDLLTAADLDGPALLDLQSAAERMLSMRLVDALAADAVDSPGISNCIDAYRRLILARAHLLRSRQIEQAINTRAEDARRHDAAAERANRHEARAAERHALALQRESARQAAAAKAAELDQRTKQALLTRIEAEIKDCTPEPPPQAG